MGLSPEREAQLRRWAENGIPATEELIAEIDRLRSALATVEEVAEAARRDLEKAWSEKLAAVEALATVEAERDDAKAAFYSLRQRAIPKGATSEGDEALRIRELQRSLADAVSGRDSALALAERLAEALRRLRDVPIRAEKGYTLVRWQEDVAFVDEALRQWDERSGAVPSGAVPGGFDSQPAPDTIDGVSRADLHRPLER